MTSQLGRGIILSPPQVYLGRLQDPKKGSPEDVPTRSRRSFKSPTGLSGTSPGPTRQEVLRTDYIGRGPTSAFGRPQDVPRTTDAHWVVVYVSTFVTDFTHFRLTKI